MLLEDGHLPGTASRAVASSACSCHPSRITHGTPVSSSGSVPVQYDPVWHRPSRSSAALTQDHIVEMTGATSPDRRAELWEMPDKRLFFMTPGTLKNDLAKGAQAAADLVMRG